jgi:AsmA-like C-terminal region
MIVSLFLVAVGLVAGLAAWRVIDAYWPYRYRNVEPLLQKVFASQIKIDHYHRIYFPHPGFVATGLTLRRNSAPDLPPIGSARDLLVQGNWLDLLLFRDRVRLVDVGGLQVVIPPVGSRANHEDFPPGSSGDFAGPTTVVEEFNVHDAELDILRVDGGRYSFPIRQLVIRNLRKGSSISYFVDMQNAIPGGHIVANGSMGPLYPDDLGATPVSGEFTFTPVNLGDIYGISGTFSANGHFKGALTAIEANAYSVTPDFAVGSGKPTRLEAVGHLTVNGLNGNIVLHSIDAHVGATTVHVSGEILGAPKVTNLDLTVTKGRAEDILRPFFKEKVPVTGSVWLQSHAYIAAAEGGQKFLQRLRMDGAFDIPNEWLTNKGTEQSLSAFSQRAQGLKQPEVETSATDPAAGDVGEVLSSLKGPARIRNGVVSTDGLDFQVPGAVVKVKGTFSLYDKSVHMVGDLHMQTDLSHVTTGFKSVLLKPFAPFFKKQNAGAVIPIAITGSPNHYQVTQDLLHKR